MVPNLSREQIEQVDRHLRAMSEAVAAAHATHDLSERQFHWNEYSDTRTRSKYSFRQEPTPPLRSRGHSFRLKSLHPTPTRAGLPCWTPERSASQCRHAAVAAGDSPPPVVVGVGALELDVVLVSEP